MPDHPRWASIVICAVLLACALPPSPAHAEVASTAAQAAPRAGEPQASASSLESAAAKAGNTGRAVAMSLIGLAFAVAGTVLAFRRDFREAAAVFAVGVVAVLLASSAGLTLLRDTVASLFGGR